MLNDPATTVAPDRPSRTATADPALTPSPFPVAAHLFTGLWVGAMVLLGVAWPDLYDAILQEDRFIEWWTVPLFAAAGVFALRRAWTGRRVFDGLVGAFCIFVAGEEFSWGQRLLGFTPPAAFLEHNVQQEFTLHNFADVFGQPKAVLILALIGFGIVLPAISRTSWGRRLLSRFGATSPRFAAVPWFALAIILLSTYPLSYTGEWVETLAGGMFLLSFAPSARAAAIAATIGAMVALGLTMWSGRSTASLAELRCAEAEAAAITRDLAWGPAATGRLAGARSVHKRVFTAVDERYIDASALSALRETDCVDDARAAERRVHMIDPWGTAYWVAMERGDDSFTLRVYSFGPNRRRDGGSLNGGGDDIGAPIVIRP